MSTVRWWCHNTASCSGYAGRKVSPLVAAIVNSFQLIPLCIIYAHFWALNYEIKKLFKIFVQILFYCTPLLHTLYKTVLRFSVLSWDYILYTVSRFCNSLDITYDILSLCYTVLRLCNTISRDIRQEDGSIFIQSHWSLAEIHLLDQGHWFKFPCNPCTVYILDVHRSI